jgi:glycosidase
MVPVDFWNDAVRQLNQIKPMFMLAEDEDNTALLIEAFDMNYSWKLFKQMHSIAKGEKNAHSLWEYLKWNDSAYAAYTFRMNFTTNHDENSWNGTSEEMFGDGAETFAVLTYTTPGMPLIYSGQEAGLNKRLRFFEKDTIEWTNLVYADFYKTLNNLKTKNKALWNGTAGGSMVEITKGQNPNVFAFLREKDGDKVLVILNLSAEPQSFMIDREMFAGNYSDVFLGQEVVVTKDQVFELLPWKYIVMESSK